MTKFTLGDWEFELDGREDTGISITHETRGDMGCVLYDILTLHGEELDKLTELIAAAYDNRVTKEQG